MTCLNFRDSQSPHRFCTHDECLTNPTLILVLLKSSKYSPLLLNAIALKNKSGSFETLADLKLLYVAKNKLELLILLSLSPDAGITSTEIHLVLGTKIRIPHTLGNHTII